MLLFFFAPHSLFFFSPKYFLPLLFYVSPPFCLVGCPLYDTVTTAQTQRSVPVHFYPKVIRPLLSPAITQTSLWIIYHLLRLAGSSRSIRSVRTGLALMTITRTSLRSTYTLSLRVSPTVKLLSKCLNVFVYQQSFQKNIQLAHSYWAADTLTTQLYGMES